VICSESFANCRSINNQIANFNNDTIIQKVETDTGSCKYTFNTGSRLIDMLTDVSLIAKPKHGIVQIQDFAVSYWAVHGYEGEDQFTVRECGMKNNQEVCSNIVYQYSITSPSQSNVGSAAIQNSNDNGNRSNNTNNQTSDKSITTKDRPINAQNLASNSPVETESNKVILLEKLAKLKSDGAISQSEFENEKAKILEGSTAAPASQITKYKNLANKIFVISWHQETSNIDGSTRPPEDRQFRYTLMNDNQMRKQFYGTKTITNESSESGQVFYPLNELFRQNSSVPYQRIYINDDTIFNEFFGKDGNTISSVLSIALNSTGCSFSWSNLNIESSGMSTVSRTNMKCEILDLYNVDFH